MMRWIIGSSLKLRLTVVAIAAAMMFFGIRQLRDITGLAQAIKLDIANQVPELVAAERRAEKHRCHIRQLMGLVDYEGVGTRQEFSESFLFQHHVGKQQMMIDDHDIRFHCGTPRLDDKAFLIIFTILAKAVFNG